MYKLDEAKDLNVYKRLLAVFQQYCEDAPASGYSKYLRAVIDGGMKMVPKDETAQEILTFLLSSASTPFCVQQLLNVRLKDLPTGLRPNYKGEGDRLETAWWKKEDKLHDKCFDLIAWDGNSTGSWVTTEGKGATLL